jgi:hypothetical protein
VINRNGDPVRSFSNAEGLMATHNALDLGWHYRWETQGGNAERPELHTLCERGTCRMGARSISRTMAAVTCTS